VDLAIATPDLSTLVSALKAGGLVATLSGAGPFTVFAPTNEAFSALPAGVLNKLLQPENKAQLVDVLTYHVVAGKVLAKDLTDGEKVKTLEGKDVTVRLVGTLVFINDAQVTTADVLASNGVVHIINAVLLPPTPDPKCRQKCQFRIPKGNCNCRCFCDVCDGKCGGGCYDKCAGTGGCKSGCPKNLGPYASASLLFPIH